MQWTSLGFLDPKVLWGDKNFVKMVSFLLPEKGFKNGLMIVNKFYSSGKYYGFQKTALMFPNTGGVTTYFRHLTNHSYWGERKDGGHRREGCSQRCQNKPCGQRAQGRPAPAIMKPTPLHLTATIESRICEECSFIYPPKNQNPQHETPPKKN